MATATHGSAIVFPKEAFDPHATLEAVREYKCTALYGVPTMFVAELDLLAHGAVPRDGYQYLRTGIAAGSSIPSELMRKLHKQLNLTELTICYGYVNTHCKVLIHTNSSQNDRNFTCFSDDNH
jgi:acyl-CoA synthetase (AMP-forming)/AMP-acid ligase II